MSAFDEVKKLAQEFLAELEKLEPEAEKVLRGATDVAGEVAKVADVIPLPGASVIAAVATDVAGEVAKVATDLPKPAAPPVPAAGWLAPAVASSAVAPAETPAKVLPAGDSLPAKSSAPVPTRQAFALAVLKGLESPTGIGPVQAFVTQYSFEDTGAAYNPGATEEPGEGATDYNSAGVKNYPDEAVGVEATVATLKNGDYGGILQALRNNEAAHIILGNEQWNTYGGESYSPKLLELLVDVQRDWGAYADVHVGTGGSGPFAPPVNEPVSLPLLKSGMTGSAVRSAQVLLSSRGYSVGTIDGDFGPVTDQATRTFQSSHDLEVSGEIGTYTWRALVTD